MALPMVAPEAINMSFFKIDFKLADRLDELVDFSAKNHASPALELDYLQKNQTYLLYHKGQIVGGFVYACKAPYRTLEIIRSAVLREACYSRFEGLKIAEITGLWLDRRYRKSIYSKILWLAIALKTCVGEADYYLFVSKSEGLIRAMNYPACTYNFLTCEERFTAGQNVIGHFFLAERKHTLIGMLQGLYYFTFKPRKKLPKKHDLGKFTIELETPVRI